MYLTIIASTVAQQWGNNSTRNLAVKLHELPFEECHIKTKLVHLWPKLRKDQTT